MKAKRFQVVRPEIEFTIEKRAGLILIQFYALFIFVKAFRLFKVDVKFMNIGTRKEWKAHSFYMLSIPRIKRADSP